MSKTERKPMFKMGLRYKYAPETFWIAELQRDGTYKKSDLMDRDTMIGYKIATGEYNKTYADITRALRDRNRKQHRSIAYGFRVKGSDTEYLWINDYVSMAGQYNIQAKLEAYKRLKEYWRSVDCKYLQTVTAKLDGGYNVESTEDGYVEVDLTKPVRFYVRNW